jgi:hypothetical protein
MTYERLEEQPRRKKWPWLVLILIVAAIVAAVLWRWAPPTAGTMAQIRTAVFSFETSKQPSGLFDSKPGQHLTKKRRADLEFGIERQLQQVLTPEFYAEQTKQYRLPHVIAGSLAEAVASARRFPLAWRFPLGETSLSDLQFVRRNLDGSVVVRIVYWEHTLWNGHTGPFFTQEYMLKKVGGSWRIADERQWGTHLDGKVTPDVGG